MITQRYYKIDIPVNETYGKNCRKKQTNCSLLHILWFMANFGLTDSSIKFKNIFNNAFIYAPFSLNSIQITEDPHSSQGLFNFIASQSSFRIQDHSFTDEDINISKDRKKNIFLHCREMYQTAGLIDGKIIHFCITLTAVTVWCLQNTPSIHVSKYFLKSIYWVSNV